jgi:hypothetical protein
MNQANAGSNCKFKVIYHIHRNIDLTTLGRLRTKEKKKEKQQSKMPLQYAY